ncbi:hypothetical protein D3C76_1329630 [compost metagenome]
MQGRKAQLPFLQQGAVHRIGQGGDQHHRIATVQAVFKQCRGAAGRHHHQHTEQRHQRAEQRTGGEALTQADDRQGQCHQRHQGEDDAHVGGRRYLGREVRQALVNRHAQNAEDKHLAQFGFDGGPIGHYWFEHERSEQQTRQ